MNLKLKLHRYKNKYGYISFNNGRKEAVKFHKNVHQLNIKQ